MRANVVSITRRTVQLTQTREGFPVTGRVIFIALMGLRVLR